MIKVLFVYSDEFCSCTRKRTFEIVKGLVKYNDNNEILTHMVYFLNLQEKFIIEHDIIIFQRLGANGGRVSERYKNELFNLINKYKKNTVFIYDIDDLIFDRQDYLPIKMMENCNASLSPNEFMESKQKQYAKETHVIRTCIDLDSFELIRPATGLNKNVVNIGWFSGNGLGLDCMNEIFPTLQEKFSGKIHIHFFSIKAICDYVNNTYKNKIFIGHNLLTVKEMFGVLKSIDFIINPMDFNDIAFQVIQKKSKKDKEDFINCKSEIKYLNAGAAGIPLITSPNSAYRKAIINGENGFIAENKEDWIKYIDLLIKSPKKRNQIGIKAKEDVYLNYSLENAADNYKNLFRKLRI